MLVKLGALSSNYWIYNKWAKWIQKRAFFSIFVCIALGGGLFMLNIDCGVETKFKWNFKVHRKPQGKFSLPVFAISLWNSWALLLLWHKEYLEKIYELLNCKSVFLKAKWSISPDGLFGFFHLSILSLGIIYHWL